MTDLAVSAPAVRSAASPRALSWLYVLISGFSGTAVMLVELAGIRLLSPTFGNSIDTWTALISVVLVALSLGNAFGGWLADRPGAREVLAGALFVSAIMTMMLPSIAALMTDVLGGLGPIAGPLLLSLVLFVIPTAAFGMLSPLALRLLSRLSGDRRVGFAAGITNGSSAIGSFIGTFATGYVLMRLIGIREIYLLTALVLLALGGLTLVMHRTRVSIFTLGGLVIALALAVTLWSSVRQIYSEAVVHSRVTPYQNLLVIDQPLEDGRTYRSLLHDRTAQGAQIVETGEMPLPYQRFSRLIELHTDAVERAAVIGGGMFGVPQLLQQRYPEAKITVLEIDPDVIDVARDWFGLDRYPQIEAIATDGRTFLQGTEQHFDFVFLDAYAGWHAIPAHLTTAEFFAAVKRRLTPDGVVLLNLISQVEPPGNELFDAIVTTASSVFGRVDVYQATEGARDELQNMMLVMGPGALDHETLVAVDDETSDLLERRIAPSEYRSRDGLLLTDNHAPVQALVARMDAR